LQRNQEKQEAYFVEHQEFPIWIIAFGQYD
jgi:hypothetical protein